MLELIEMHRKIKRKIFIASLTPKNRAPKLLKLKSEVQIVVVFPSHSQCGFRPNPQVPLKGLLEKAGDFSERSPLMNHYDYEGI